MALRLHNSLTKQKADFIPPKQGPVSIYTCGPTVYGPAHIGNLRTYVFNDTLRRWLKHGHALAVRQVMNVTDVEDKILAASKATDVAAMVAYTKPFEERFFADLDALGVERAEGYPRATAYVPQIIKLIEAILKAGYAYERDGSVYFDVRKYDGDHGYGALTKVDFAGFERGHRIDNDEYDKDNVQDFALWKAAETGTPGWDSPWGYGRPGWHVECSAMVHGELGEPIDIHTGAVDLKFPHHENEIAQSKAATGNELAKVWLHGEHLLVEKAKMAKSEGNIVTLEDVTAKGFTPQALRLLFLQAHYRTKLNFTWDALKAAKESYQRIQDLLAKLDGKGDGKGVRPAITKLDKDLWGTVAKAMDDDLGSPQALADVFEAIRSLNTLRDKQAFNAEESAVLKGIFARLHQVFGVFERESFQVPAKVTELFKQRELARQAGDFDKSDHLRDELAKAGWLVEDTEHGATLRKQA